MATSGGADRWEAAESKAAAVRSRLPLTDSLVLWGVFVAVVLALVLRFVLLGHRVAHFDEGRVAYWSVHTLDTGHFAYRRIIHGPLIQHLDRYLFALVGASDFTMRAPVALVGGLLPATALLFRKHLRRMEVVAMAFVLALNPIILYYSRFMRSDILVAAFMFTAFGFLVRYYDTRNHRYLYAVAAFAMLGFGSKENAIVYILTWLGAAALLVDQALFRPRNHDSGAHLLWAKGVATWHHVRDDRLEPWLDDLDAAIDRLGAEEAADGAASRLTVIGRALSPLRFVWYALVIVAIAIAVFLWVYAPRGAGYAGLTYPLADASAHLGLWDAVGSPAKLPALFDATFDRTYTEFVRWFSASTSPGCGKENIIDGYLCYAGRFVRAMARYAAPMTAFAVFGFLAERWGAARSRNLVLFSAYCGFVAVIGYPLGTDIWGAWIIVHALVPLSIPAAVGIGVIGRWGAEAWGDRDGLGVAIAVALLVLATGFAGVVAVDSVYTNDQSADNELVQYAQPAGDMQAVLAAMDEAAAAHDGTDVLLYDTGGGELVRQDQSSWDRADGALALDPMCSHWHDSLPLPWYFAASDAEVDCVTQSSALGERLNEDPVPVVITAGEGSIAPADALESDYVAETHNHRTTDSPMTYWVHEDYADGLGDG